MEILVIERHLNDLQFKMDENKAKLFHLFLYCSTIYYETSRPNFTLHYMVELSEIVGI